MKAVPNGNKSIRAQELIYTDKQTPEKRGADPFKATEIYLFSCDKTCIKKLLNLLAPREEYFV